jgi:hypothetical protein
VEGLWCIPAPRLFLNIQLKVRLVASDLERCSNAASDWRGGNFSGASFRPHCSNWAGAIGSGPVGAKTWKFQGFSEHQHQRRRTPPHLVRPFGGPANPRLTSWTFPTNLPPGPSETIMNVAPLVRRPLGCLKATFRQTRHQRLLVRQMATEASQTASEQRPPELSFCRPSLSLYPRLLSG